jgi:hypothetical protein
MINLRNEIGEGCRRWRILGDISGVVLETRQVGKATMDHIDTSPFNM